MAGQNWVNVSIRPRASASRELQSSESLRLQLGEAKVRLVTYCYANKTGTTHRADEKLLEKWWCLGNCVLSSVENIVIFICVFFAWSRVYHCLGSTSEGVLASFSSTLSFISFCYACPCWELVNALFSGWKFVFSQSRTELSLQWRSFAHSYCFQMCFYYGKKSEFTVLVWSCLIPLKSLVLIKWCRL